MFLSLLLDVLKKYWWILIVLAVFGWFYVQQQRMKEILDISNNSYRKQIDILKEYHVLELKEKEKLLEKYMQEKKLLTSKYLKAKKNLKNNKNKDIEKIIQEKPNELAKRIEELYGFEYFPYESFSINP